MHVTINQQERELPDGATVADVLAAIGAKPPYAVAVNLQFVPKTHYATRTLAPQDRVEVIAPVTGG